MPWIFSQLQHRFGVLGSFSSLFRVHIWIVVGLVAFGAIKPAPSHDQLSSGYNEKIKSDWVREIGADRNDWRGFHVSGENSEVFRIGWVGGSSLQSIGDGYYEFIPSLVQERIAKVNGLPVDIDIYFLSGIRLWDEYVGVLEALNNDVDLLVLTLNPLWVFNDEAIQGWPNLNSVAAPLVVSRPEAWLLSLGLLTPVDFVAGLLGKNLPSVYNRWSYNKVISERMPFFSALDRSNPPPEPEKISNLARIGQFQIPIFFWNEHRDSRPPGLSLFEAQAALLQQADPSRSSWNQQILGWIGSAVVDSEVPTFIYLAPLATDSMKTKEVAVAVEGLEAHLNDYSTNFEGEKVKFIPQSLSRYLPAMEFNDLVHVGEALPLADYLASMICQFTEEQGFPTECDVVGTAP